jgi:hypothetical protein
VPPGREPTGGTDGVGVKDGTLGMEGDGSGLGVTAGRCTGGTLGDGRLGGVTFGTGTLGEGSVRPGTSVCPAAARGIRIAAITAAAPPTRTRQSRRVSLLSTHPTSLVVSPFFTEELSLSHKRRRKATT